MFTQTLDRQSNDLKTYTCCLDPSSQRDSVGDQTDSLDTSDSQKVSLSQETDCPNNQTDNVSIRRNYMDGQTSTLNWQTDG